jgi:hypothetical protein
LPDTDLGELQDTGPARHGAGIGRHAEKVWNANIELASIDYPRQGVGTLEREVLKRCRTPKRPAELVGSGCRHLQHAAALWERLKSWV